LPATDTMDRVKTVIRICLQLDAETAIPDDMALMEGDYDIDSLDVLLIITELERAFDINIADGEMKKVDLVTIESLSSFIDSLCNTTTAKDI
jgi:acyl carrier protein